MGTEQLIGYWSDGQLYQGAMEDADLVFRSDHTGWAYWSRIGGPFSLLRFTWNITDPGVLAVELVEELGGVWRIRDESVDHEVRWAEPMNHHLVTGYRIGDSTDVLGRAVTLLELDESVSPGAIGNRFAFLRPLRPNEQDPCAGGE